MDNQEKNQINNSHWTKITPLHYLVGGVLGVLVAKLLDSELSLLMGVFAFIAWPLVLAFGFLVLIIRIIFFVIGLIF